MSPGKKILSPWKLTDKCSTRKKEKINEREINTISQQKIIHLGAKRFKKLLDMIINFIWGTRIRFQKIANEINFI